LSSAPSRRLHRTGTGRTIVREIRPGSVLTLVKASGASNGDAGDMYAGLDRFGRVVNQQWVTADTLSSGTGGDTLGTTTEQFEYGYDEDSNVLYQDNMVHSADSELFHANSTTSGDDSTAYDPLNRLTNFRRGTLSSSGNNGSTLDKVTSASGSNSWSLDALGNDTSGGTAFNSKNQISSRGGSTSITYDDDGNMTEDQDGNTYTYDAWNRMVYAYLSDNPDNPNQYYSYNADNERPGLSVCNGVTTTSYYSTQWQVLEEDATTPSSPCVGATTTVSTYLWSEAYIDELVARDSSVDGGSVTRIFAQQDANHDITSLVNSSGTVLERFIYDPYGVRTVLSASWASTTDSYNWVYGFQGGRLDPLTGLINFRNRDLNPTLGVWMEQDPAGYVNGANMYEFVDDSPTFYSDPDGLDAVPPTVPTSQPTTGPSTRPSTPHLNKWGSFLTPNLTPLPNNAGMTAVLKFKPSSNCGCDEYAAIQISRVSKIGGYNPGGLLDTRYLSDIIGADADGWHVDIPTPQNQGDLFINNQVTDWAYPYYGMNPPTPATPGAKYIWHNSQVSWDKTFFALNDTPQLPGASLEFQYETYFVCTKGTDADHGVLYGGISWGFDTSSNKPSTPLPSTFLGGPSPNLAAAIAAWNNSRKNNKGRMPLPKYGT